MELKNDHNVYILGAGFSVERGYPVMADFLNRMRDAHPWLVENERFGEAEAVKNILEFRLRSASAGYRITSDLENIEELFSLAAATPGANKLMDDVRSSIGATLDYCKQISEEPDERIEAKIDSLRMPCSESPNSASRIDGCKIYKTAMYDQIVAAMCGAIDKDEMVGENTFITFNYDTLVESALSNLKLPWTYGFEGERVVWHESFRPMQPKNSDPMIPVYKLHGSVNWAYASGRGKGFTIFGDYKDVVDDNNIPELVPPTWRKSFDHKMSRIWDNSVQALRTATRIIIVGFSIPETDMHFKHLIAAGLQENVSLRQILFVSPDGRIRDRAEKIFRDLKMCTFEKTYTRTLSSKDGILRLAGRAFPDVDKY